MNNTNQPVSDFKSSDGAFEGWNSRIPIQLNFLSLISAWVVVFKWRNNFQTTGRFLVTLSFSKKYFQMLKISNSDARNSAIWLDASIHSREWISTAVVTYIADYIARNFHSLPTSITNKDWFVLQLKVGLLSLIFSRKRNRSNKI